MCHRHSLCRKRWIPKTTAAVDGIQFQIIRRGSHRCAEHQSESQTRQQSQSLTAHKPSPCKKWDRFETHLNDYSSSAFSRASSSNRESCSNCSLSMWPSSRWWAALTGPSNSASSAWPVSVIAIFTMRRSSICRCRLISPRFSDRSSSRREVGVAGDHPPGNLLTGHRATRPPKDTQHVVLSPEKSRRFSKRRGRMDSRSAVRMQFSIASCSGDSNGT